MSFITNVNHVDKEDGKSEQLNTSMSLDTLASKLNRFCLSEAANAYLERDHNKTRFADLLSGMSTIYWLIKTSNNKPIFIVQNSYDPESTDGFYFFIGTHQEIENKLKKLAENSENLKQFCY